MKRTSTSLIALGMALALAVGCAQSAGGDDLLTIGGDEGPTAPQTSDDPSAVAQRAVADVTDYWREIYPEVYGDEWVDVAGFYPYGPDTEVPPCGPYEITYEEIANNAFYCPDDDIIAWDEGQLMPQLNEDFGAFTVAIVIAHEYGHAVQARFGTPDRTVDLELQADCFAGSWTRRVADGDVEGFEPADIDLDKTVAGLISIRDVPGTDPNDIMAHGSGFDRVAAFQDGYENGAEQCAEYADPEADRPTVELEFDRSEASTGGNLPLEDDWDGQGSQGLLSLVEQDLNDYYTQVFDELGEQFTPVDDLVIVDSSSSVSCGDEQLSADETDFAAFYCVDDNTVVLGAELIEVLHQDIGDFAVASEIALLWATAAQEQLGIEASDDAALQADCLTGAWASWTYPDDTPPSSEVLRMSGGDLDEGLMAFLAYAGEDSGTAVFDRSEAVRTGFFEGYDACEEYGSLT